MELLLLLLAASGPALGQAQDDAASGVQAILERSRRAPARAATATAADLARLGSGSIPALLEALAESRAPADREPILLALGALPILDLRAQARRCASGPARDELRCAVIEVLGVCGNSGDLDTMVRAAAGATALDEGGLVTGTLELAAGRLLEKDASSYARIGALVPGCVPPLRDALFAAVAAREDPASLRLFARVARDAPELAPLALAHLARAGTRAARPIDDDVLQAVRSILSQPSSPALPEAALAAGFLDDYAAIPRLVDLLDDARAGVRENARWALSTLSGLDLRGGSDRWRAWHRAEQSWRRDELPGIELDFESGEKERIAVALESIAGKRCHRHELAKLVARLLRHDDPEVAALACDALRLLRSSAVREALEACREHAAPEVREAAARALAAIEEDAANLGRPGHGPGRRRGAAGA